MASVSQTTMVSYSAWLFDTLKANCSDFSMMMLMGAFQDYPDSSTIGIWWPIYVQGPPTIVWDDVFL